MQEANRSSSKQSCWSSTSRVASWGGFQTSGSLTPQWRGVPVKSTWEDTQRQAQGNVPEILSLGWPGKPWNSIGLAGGSSWASCWGGCHPQCFPVLHIVAYTVIFFIVLFSIVSQISTKVEWKCPIKPSTTSKASNTHQGVSLIPIYPRLKWLNFLFILPLKIILRYICAFFEGSFTLVCNTFWACSVLCSLIPPHPFGVILSKKCDSVQSRLTLSISSYSALSLTSSSHFWHNILGLLSQKLSIQEMFARYTYYTSFPFRIPLLHHVWACAVIPYLLDQQVIGKSVKNTLADVPAFDLLLLFDSSSFPQIIFPDIFRKWKEQYHPRKPHEVARNSLAFIIMCVSFMV